MRRAKALSNILAVAIALSLAAPATAQLSEFVWDSSKTGAQLWQQSGNWTPAGFPNGPLQTADVSRPLGANLTLNIGGGVTVAGLKLGGTATAVTTDITSGVGGLLTFRNDEMPPMLTGNADFNGDSYVNGQDFLIWQRGLGLMGQTNNNQGDADANTVVEGPDLGVWQDQFGLGSETFALGSGFIQTTGVAGVVNTISAGIHSDNEQIEIAGDRNLTINGDFSYVGDPNNGGASAASLRVLSPGLTTTLNGNVTVADSDALEGVDLLFNDSERNQGMLVINGLISGTGDVAIGAGSNAARLPLGTVILNGANTYTGSIRAGRGNLVLGHDNALGVNGATLASYRQAGPANQFGYNLISTDDNRVISNPMVVAQWQSFKGDHSLEWAGDIEQTNNRGVINLLPSGKELKLSGRINIFEEAESGVVRRFEIHGTGATRITGSVRDLPDDALNFPEDHRLVKRGLGVLTVDVAAGGNSHIGDDVIYMGNWHYADNDSLNVGGGQIQSYGGAIGVDTGVIGNTDFISRIRPASTGGLQLAPSDAAATLDFTTTLANAANMTVAAPETGLSFTGSINPAGGRYQLGGGAGALTLPNAQLTGSNRLEVRNGGVVQLLGDNTYTGSTTILTKYASTNDAAAAADSNNENLSVGRSYYAQVAPTLVVDKLSNGGVASSIGAASSDAANLLIQGSTLKYVGPGDSTNRLFTIGTGGATLDASGTGAVAFTNTAALGRDDAEDRIGTLDDFSRNPDQLYDLTDTSDIVIGMTVTDPDPGGAGAPPLTAPLIPAGTVVTGVSDDGTELGLSNSYGFRLKQNTRLVFGTVPRTLTLTGTNAGQNTLASTISNSAKGGVVGVDKTGAGTWILTASNDYTGATTVSQGTLLVNGVQTGGGAYTVAPGATVGGVGTLGGALTVSGAVAPGATGSAGALTVSGAATFNAGANALFQIGGAAAGQYDELNLSGALTAGGTLTVNLINGFVPSVGNSFDVLDFTTASGAFALSLPSLGAGKAWNASSLLTTGTLSIAAAAVAIPEPQSAALIAVSGLSLWRRTRRRSSTAIA